MRTNGRSVQDCDLLEISQNFQLSDMCRIIAAICMGRKMIDVENKNNRNCIEVRLLFIVSMTATFPHMNDA